MATTLLNKPKGLASAAGLTKPATTVVKPLTTPSPIKQQTPIVSEVPESPGRGINETPSYTDTRPPSERTPAPVTPKTGPGISDVPETPGKVWRNGEFVDTRVPGEGTGTGAWKNGEFVDTRVPGENGGGGVGAWKNGEFVDTRVPGEGGGGGVKTPTPGGIEEQKLFNSLQPGYDPKTGLITPIKTGGGISDIPERPGDGINPKPGGGGISDIPERPGDKINPPLQPMPNGALPSGLSNPTMTTRVDPADPASTAKSYAEWAAKAAAQVDDSTANKLRDMLREDSPLMQQARTDGLKAANSRGLLNSSMAAGASQDAMIRAATPIAQQDASQAFQKNLQSSDYTYGLASQFAGQEFTGDQAARDRALQVKMQNASLNAADQQQINDIKSREGTAAAERALSLLMQDKDIKFQSGESALNRSLEERMQDKTITAADRQQIRDIESREGTAAAERALQEKLQQKDIEFQTSESGKSRELQKWIAEANLDSSDRNAASQFITNMETMYQTSYQSIMANTALSAAQRTEQLTAAARMRDQQLDFVRQMYDVELVWGQAGGTPTTPTTPTPTTPTPTTPRPTTPVTPTPVTPRTPATGPGGGRSS